MLEPGLKQQYMLNHDFYLPKRDDLSCFISQFRDIMERKKMN